MAKWTRVGDIPNKIPVNFVVDSRQYPELAAWIYAFPHGEMGKAVREILNAHAKGGAPAGTGAAARSPVAAPTSVVAVSEVSGRHSAADAGSSPDSGGDETPPVMDESTRRTLLQIGQDS